jgi:hypothetical protein
MDGRRSLTLLELDLDFARLVIDIQGLLLWWLLESFSLDQIIALGLVLLLGLRRPTAPSSCRRSPS